MLQLDRWQTIAGHMAPIFKSHRPSQWKPRRSVNRHAKDREFPDNNGLKAHLADTAVNKVMEAYASWHSNGRPSDNHPTGQFGTENYMVLPHDCLTVAANDRGYGVKVSAVPYDPVWFHIDGHDRIDDYCRRLTDANDPLQSGRGELRHDQGTLTLHLSITEPIDVYKPAAVDRVLGVDLGERILYATGCLERDGTVRAVTVESGREFRHHRNRLQQKRDDAQQRGDKPTSMACRHEREQYTDHTTHVAAREIIDSAIDHAPCAVALEDLTNYRDTATDPIHDWPYEQLQQKIAYKATEAGIPTITIDPAGTSVTCRHCGCHDPMNRDGDTFACIRCEYTVHADVNAALNIAHTALHQ